MSMEMEKINPIWDSGNFVLMSGITDESCLMAINFILYHNMKESPLDMRLTLVINSPGGSVSAAFALIDVMKTSKIPVDTIATGSIASCGVLLTMSGVKKGKGVIVVGKAGLAMITHGALRVRAHNGYN